MSSFIKKTKDDRDRDYIKKRIQDKRKSLNLKRKRKEKEAFRKSQY